MNTNLNNIALTTPTLFLALISICALSFLLGIIICVQIRQRKELKRLEIVARENADLSRQYCGMLRKQ